MIKTRFYLLLGLALGFLLTGCSVQAAKIEIEKDFIDLGDMVNGEVVTTSVTVRNTGNGSLVVEAVSTSCGCTTATLDPMTIPPGESGILEIKFDSGAHGPEEVGEIIRQIFIASNDPDHEEVVLDLRANVLPRPEDPTQ